MKTILATLVIGVITLSAQTTPETTPLKKKTVVKQAPKKAPVPGALVIPKDAKKNPDGSYAWVDKTGQKWIYRQTPFGVMRAQDSGPAVEDKLTNVQAIDKGDTVSFERKTPFGAFKVEKKKSELTDDERALLQQQSAPQQSGQQPPKPE